MTARTQVAPVAATALAMVVRVVVGMTGVVSVMLARTAPRWVNVLMHRVWAMPPSAPNVTRWSKPRWRYASWQPKPMVKR